VPSIRRSALQTHLQAMEKREMGVGRQVGQFLKPVCQVELENLGGAH
jgi:hypothetical protein